MKLLFLLFVVIFASNQWNQAVFINDPWPELKIGVWNTMQQPWITNWTSEVNAHLQNTDVDVLHVIEIWTEAERDRILSNANIRDQFPFRYTPTVRNSNCGCNIDEQQTTNIINFLGCANMHGIKLQELIQPFPNPLPFMCQMAGMGIALYNNDKNNFLCLACVINTAQTLPQGISLQDAIQTIIWECGNQRGNKFAYGGINGQLILSKFQIRNVTESFFNGWLANRINIYATIKGVRLAFGHFAYNVIEDFNPSAKFLMYGDTQPQQAQDMLLHNPDVIVGDLNTGPDYQRDGYNILINGGYVSGFAVQPQTYCAPSHANFTMCRDGIGGSFTPQSIDHILIRSSDLLRIKDAELFNVLPLMSDHVGIRAVVSKKP